MNSSPSLLYSLCLLLDLILYHMAKNFEFALMKDADWLFFLFLCRFISLCLGQLWNECEWLYKVVFLPHFYLSFRSFDRINAVFSFF